MKIPIQVADGRWRSERPQWGARLLTFLRCRTVDLLGKRDSIYVRVFPHALSLAEQGHPLIWTR